MIRFFFLFPARFAPVLFKDPRDVALFEEALFGLLLEALRADELRDVVLDVAFGARFGLGAEVLRV